LSSNSAEPGSGRWHSRYLAVISGQAQGPWPTLQRLLLGLAALPYGLAVRARNLLYRLGWKRSDRVAVPVLSVGNLTAGGTGKTPCVEYLARWCRSQDLRVAILSRGYGARAGRNDEALVLEENLPDVPHLLGPDRVELARTAIEELESQVLVLDDGFQHRRLARDLDLVLIDATNPWGYGRLLPRGLLREPPSGLRRAGVVLLTRCDQVDADARRRLRERVASLAPDAPVVETTHRPTELVNSDREESPLISLRDRPVAAFCGIGNPAAFRRTLADLGASVADFRTYPDHHPYTRDDVAELERWSRTQPDGGLLVTTQKDLVKLRVVRLGERPLWAVRVRLAVEAGEEQLHERLRAAVQPALAGAGP
jgi:tetraacyldisaccharide 4'-kinase